jgi:hypothetical protein
MPNIVTDAKPAKKNENNISLNDYSERCLCVCLRVFVCVNPPFVSYNVIGAAGAGQKQRVYSASAGFAVTCFGPQSYYGPVGKTLS